MYGREGLRIGLISVVIVAALIVVVSLVSVGEVNPIEVYSGGGWISKLAVTLLGLVFGVLVMNLFIAFTMVHSVENVCRIPAEDVVCPGCGNPLLRFVGSHGLPIFCPNSDCKNRAWHNGPMCYNKGMNKPKISYPKYLCPRCRDKLNDNADLSDTL